MSLPNAYLRCESRRPHGACARGLWTYGLVLVLVLAAALDALWLVPMREAHEAQARAESAQREAREARVAWFTQERDGLGAAAVVREALGDQTVTVCRATTAAIAASWLAVHAGPRHGHGRRGGPRMDAIYLTACSNQRAIANEQALQAGRQQMTAVAGGGPAVSSTPEPP